MKWRFNNVFVKSIKIDPQREDYLVKLQLEFHCPSLSDLGEFPACFDLVEMQKRGTIEVSGE